MYESSCFSPKSTHAYNRGSFCLGHQVPDNSPNYKLPFFTQPECVTSWHAIDNLNGFL